MLDNEIVIPVAVVMGGATTDISCRRADFSSGKSLYKLPGHSYAAKNQLQCFANEPKPSGNFMGTRRTSVKYTHGVTVAGRDLSTSVVAPIIVELSCSIPVGVSDEDAIAARQVIVCFAGQAEVINTLNLRSEV